MEQSDAIQKYKTYLKRKREESSRKNIQSDEILKVMFKPLPFPISRDLETKQMFRQTIIGKQTKILPKSVHYKPTIDKTKITKYSDYVTELKEFLKTEGKKKKRKKLSKYRCENFDNTGDTLEALAKLAPSHHIAKKKNLEATLTLLSKTQDEQDEDLEILRAKWHHDPLFVPKVDLDKQFEYYYKMAETFMSGQETEDQRKMNVLTVAAEQIDENLTSALDSIKDELNEEEMAELERFDSMDALEDEELDCFFKEMQNMMSMNTTGDDEEEEEEDEEDEIMIEDETNTDDFAKNVNKNIDENKTNLAQRIQDVPLQIKDVKPGDIVDVTGTDIPGDIVDGADTHVPGDIVDGADPVADGTDPVVDGTDTVVDGSSIDLNGARLGSMSDQNLPDTVSKVVTGTMNADIPEDCTEEENQQIEKFLEESIANSLVGKDPKDVKVTMNSETGEATYEISADNATLAEEIQKIIKKKSAEAKNDDEDIKADETKTETNNDDENIEADETNTIETNNDDENIETDETNTIETKNDDEDIKADETNTIETNNDDEDIKADETNIETNVDDEDIKTDKTNTIETNNDDEDIKADATNIETNVDDEDIKADETNTETNNE